MNDIFLTFLWRVGVFSEQEAAIKLLSSARKLPEADRDAAEAAGGCRDEADIYRGTSKY